MATVTTGRTLDDHGNPVAETGFELDPDSWLADRIRERTGPVTSHPTRPVWGIPLETSDDTIRTLSVFGPGYGGPPEHYHEQSPERFEVECGSLTMTLDGTDREVMAGETATVETGVTHTFENHTDERAVVTTQERFEPLSNLLTPVAELAGYQGAYATYTQPSFWERHVEQPDL